MNILVLNNYGGGVSTFLVDLASELSKDNKVMILFDSSFSKSCVGDIDARCHVMTLNKELEALGEARLGLPGEFNRSRVMCSDIERSIIFGLKYISAQQYEDLCTGYYTLFCKVIDKYQIDLVVYENISNSLAYMAYFACRTQGAAYCGITSSRLPGFFSVDSGVTYERQRLISELSKEISATDFENKMVTEYFENIDSAVPDGLTEASLHTVNLLEKYFKVEKFRILVLAIYYSLKKDANSYLLGDPLSAVYRQFYRSVHRFINIKRISRYFTEPVSGQNYFLYPLHFHPESSTSVKCPEYMDELSVIRNISFYLPKGYLLYVKDHPSASGYPREAFYRELSMIPGVRLLHPKFNAKQLIRGSKGVITQTGTAGLEALMLQKPVIAFGEIFYSCHKGCILFTSWEQFKRDINEIISGDLEINSEYNRLFLTAYLRTKYKGTLTFNRKSGDYKKFLALSKQAIFEELKYFD